MPITVSIGQVRDKTQPDRLSSGAPIRILVVEDNADDQELLRRLLQKVQVVQNILFLSDPVQALDLLSRSYSHAFNRELIAIFLDIHLPQMTGIELLRKIRQMPDMKDFPVIMMTASSDPKNLEECQQLRVASYIEKPVTLHSFSMAIANIFPHGIRGQKGSGFPTHTSSSGSDA